MCHGAPWDVMGQKFSMDSDTPLNLRTLSWDELFALHTKMKQDFTRDETVKSCEQFFEICGRFKAIAHEKQRHDSISSRKYLFSWNPM